MLPKVVDLKVKVKINYEEEIHNQLRFLISKKTDKIYDPKYLTNLKQMAQNSLQWFLNESGFNLREDAANHYYEAMNDIIRVQMFRYHDLKETIRTRIKLIFNEFSFLQYKFDQRALKKDLRINLIWLLKNCLEYQEQNNNGDKEFEQLIKWSLVEISTKYNAFQKELIKNNNPKSLADKEEIDTLFAKLK